MSQQKVGKTVCNLCTQLDTDRSEENIRQHEFENKDKNQVDEEIER